MVLPRGELVAVVTRPGLALEQGGGTVLRSPSAAGAGKAPWWGNCAITVCGSTHAAALADACGCVGRCMRLRWPMHRGASGEVPAALVRGDAGEGKTGSPPPLSGSGLPLLCLSVWQALPFRSLNRHFDLRSN